MKSLKKYFTLIAIALIFNSCSKTRDLSATDMKNNAQAEKMKEAYKNITKIFETGNVKELDKWVDQNALSHSVDTNITKKTGVEGMKESIGFLHSAFSDIKMDIQHVVVEGNMLMSYGTLTATNTGALGDTPATGKSFKIDVVDIVRFENGKAVENWSLMDRLKMMQDLGFFNQD